MSFEVFSGTGSMKKGNLNNIKYIHIVTLTLTNLRNSDNNMINAKFFK